MTEAEFEEWCEETQEALEVRLAKEQRTRSQTQRAALRAGGTFEELRFGLQRTMYAKAIGVQS